MDLITLEYNDLKDENSQKKSLKFSKDLLTKPYKKESLFVIKVDGESMEPIIKNHALVVADLSQIDIINGDIYLVYQNNKMWIKKAKIKCGITTFVSINKKFSHLVFKKEESRVVAKAVLTFTTL